MMITGAKKFIKLAGLVLLAFATFYIPVIGLASILILAALVMLSKLAKKTGLMLIAVIALITVVTSVYRLSTGANLFSLFNPTKPVSDMQEITETKTDCFVLKNIFKGIQDTNFSSTFSITGCNVTLSNGANAVAVAPFEPSNGAPKDYAGLKTAINSIVKSNSENYKNIRNPLELTFMGKQALQVNATDGKGNTFYYVYFEVPKSYKASLGTTKYFVTKVSSEDYISQVESSLKFK